MSLLRGCPRPPPWPTIIRCRLARPTPAPLVHPTAAVATTTFRLKLWLPPLLHGTHSLPFAAPAHSRSLTSNRDLQSPTPSKDAQSPTPSQDPQSPTLSKDAPTPSSSSAAGVAYIPKSAYIGEWKSRTKHLRRKVTEVDANLHRIETLEGSQKVVTLAIFSNLTMFIAKLYGAVQSGSASMFSEALHSLADMFNECLLMWGIWRSLRRPDSEHPYGFSSERYAWALVSGVGVFFLGGGVSLYHGVSGLLSNAHALGDPTSSLWVLGASLAFELTTMAFAFSQISKSARAVNLNFWDFLVRGGDPTSVQVFLEDCAAVAGIIVAGVCLSLSKFLDLAFIDSLGSITIGLILSAAAAFLIRRNIAGLVEKSMRADKQEQIVELLRRDPTVVSVHDIKSTSIGPEWTRFKAEILFDGAEVTRRYMDANPTTIASEIQSLRNTKSDDEIRAWMMHHGAQVVSSLGAEVDRLEVNIKAQHPEVKHIDLEIL